MIQVKAPQEHEALRSERNQRCCQPDGGPHTVSISRANATAPLHKLRLCCTPLCSPCPGLCTCLCHLEQRTLLESLAPYRDSISLVPAQTQYLTHGRNFIGDERRHQWTKVWLYTSSEKQMQHSYKAALMSMRSHLWVFAPYSSLSPRLTCKAPWSGCRRTAPPPAARGWCRRPWRSRAPSAGRCWYQEAAQRYCLWLTGTWPEPVPTLLLTSVKDSLCSSRENKSEMRFSTRLKSSQAQEGRSAHYFAQMSCLKTHLRNKNT